MFLGYSRYLFVKKRFEIVLIASINITTDVYSYRSFYGEFICTHLFLFLRIFDYLWSSTRIFTYLWSSMRISSYLWPSMRIFPPLWSFVKIYLFKSLWKQASVWIPSSNTYVLSSKYDKDILSISWVPNLCFLLWVLLILCLIIFFTK